ncbi:uncharacterized protein PG998_003379 [Apiospora kogelbergensis]|uniref:uncharacterized protein n=1 Tax=Apiospora kogelbergensis TaxID=1337665 RepID=UPI003130EDB8
MPLRVFSSLDKGQGNTLKSTRQSHRVLDIPFAMDILYNEDRPDQRDLSRVKSQMRDGPSTNQTLASAPSESIKEATPAPTSSNSSSHPSPVPQSSASNGPSPNVVVGSIIGCIAVPILALLAIVWWRRRRRWRLSMGYDTRFGNLPYAPLRSPPGSSGHGYRDARSPPYTDGIPLRPFKAGGGKTRAHPKAVPPVSPFSPDYNSEHGQPPAAVDNPPARPGPTMNRWFMLALYFFQIDISPTLAAENW